MPLLRFGCCLLLFLLPGYARGQEAGQPDGRAVPHCFRAAAARRPAGPGTPAFFTPPPSSGIILAETRTPPASFESGPEDRWLAYDKVQHVTFSFLWTLGSQYTLVNKASLEEGQALPVSASAAALIGLTKEYYDWRVKPTHHFSRRDLAADAVGILLAAGLILL